MWTDLSLHDPPEKFETLPSFDFQEYTYVHASELKSILLNLLRSMSTYTLGVNMILDVKMEKND